MLLGSAAALAQPAAAGHDNAIYNKRQTWFLVDRNRDGRISAQEWDFARDHGYDRLQGVPKKRLSRNEYQAYLTEYLNRHDGWRDRRSWNRGSLHSDWWQDNRPWGHGLNHGWQQGWQKNDWQHRGQDRRGPEAGPPWYVTRDGVLPWTYGQGRSDLGRGERGAR